MINCSELALPHWTGTHRYQSSVIDAMLSLVPGESVILSAGVNSSLTDSPEATSLLSAARDRGASVWQARSRAAYHLGLPWQALCRRASVYYNMSGGVRPCLPMPCKRVALVHDCFRFIYPESYGVTNREAELRRVRRVLSKTDHIICVSNFTRKSVVELFEFPATKTSVVYGGVNEVATAPVECDERDPFVLMVNPGRGNKNWQDLFAAMEHLWQAPDQRLRLVVAGMTGDQETAIQEWIRQRPALAAKIRLTGYVEQNVLDDLYARCLCVVVPSRFEGFGLPVIEAMARGKPTIVSAIDAFTEVAGDDALTFELGDVPALSAHIAAILSNRALRHEFAIRGLARASRFTWAASAKATIDVLTSVEHS
jgi:glycosyltransferase involved in cell wall biosynthesis